jgi:hypothetical protein
MNLAHRISQGDSAGQWCVVVALLLIAEGVLLSEVERVPENCFRPGRRHGI